MVGVPRRSQGCSACRKRKSKCDLTRPTCAGCLKHGIDCQFVTAGFTFVHNDPGTHRSIYRKTDRVGLPVETPRKTCTKIDAIVIPCSPSSPPRSCTVSHPASHSIDSLPLMQQQLHARAHSDIASWHIHDVSVMKVWMLAIQSFITSASPLKGAPLACYVSWSARGAAGDRMVSVSRHLYVQGLKEVREALRRKETAETDETLAACAALAMYEAIENPDACKNGYQIHERAALRLLELRGAERHQHGVAHELFLAVRVHGVLDAYEQRRPNFLSSQEWMTVPWQFKEKDAYNRLVDIFACGPRLLQAAVELDHTPQAQILPKLLTLISQMLDHDDQLETFYASLVSSSDEPLYYEYHATVSDSGISDCSDDNLSPPPPPFCFSSPETAQLLTLYWAKLAVLWSGLENLYSALCAHNAEQILKSTPRGQRMTKVISDQYWLTNIRKIIRSNTYAAAAATTSQSPPVNGIAIEIAKGVLSQQGGSEAELAEVLAARRVIGENWMQGLLAYGEEGISMVEPRTGWMKDQNDGWKYERAWNGWMPDKGWLPKSGQMMAMGEIVTGAMYPRKACGESSAGREAHAGGTRRVTALDGRRAWDAACVAAVGQVEFSEMRFLRPKRV